MDEPDYLKDHLDTKQDFEVPHSEEAERALLGQILLSAMSGSESTLLQAIELLDDVNDFYIPANKRIYAAMVAIFDAGKDLNVINIGEELKKTNSLQMVGGFTYITSLSYGLPHSDSIEHYANVLIGKSKLRNLLKAADKISQEVKEEEDDADVILGHAESAIYSLTETRFKTQLATIDEMLEQVVDDAISNAGSGLAITGLQTGITKLDQMTAGFQPSDLILLAARPGMGKTSEAVTIINNMAVDYEKRIAFFSLEMNKYSIVTRMICNLARVDFQRFRQGLVLTAEDWDKIEEARNRLSCGRIFIDDKPAISILEARAKLRRLANTAGMPDIILFDYLQLMTGRREHRKESRLQEVSGISADLKTLAKELNRPVVGLCQLNRGPEQRSNKTPALHDLRESGSLEQDADQVIFIHQPEVDEEHEHVYQQIIAKNRNGPTGEFGIMFNKPAMRFENLYNG